MEWNANYYVGISFLGDELVERSVLENSKGFLLASFWTLSFGRGGGGGRVSKSCFLLHVRTTVLKNLDFLCLTKIVLCGGLPSRKRAPIAIAPGHSFKPHISF